MRSVRFTAFLCFALLWEIVAHAAEPPPARVCHHAGDDPRWAARDWADQDWEPGGGVPARTGIQWIRFHFQMPRATDRGPSEGAPLRMGFMAVLDGSEPVNCIQVGAACSYEFYWDGRLLSRSGVVGRTREEETPGLLDNLIALSPDLLGPGEHVIAFRLSSFHYNFPAKEVAPVFIIGSYQTFFNVTIRRVFYPLMSVGGALLITVLSVVLYWLADRWRPLLLCGVVGLVLTVFYFLIAWRFLHNDPYPWLAPRLMAITALMTCAAGLFPWLLLEQFNVPHRRWWLLALVPLLAVAWWASPLYQVKVLWLARAMLVVSLGITGWAMKHRRPGAWLVLCTVLAGLLTVRAGRLEFLHSSFFITFTALVVVVFATLGAQVRAQRRQAMEAKLTAARLETELLKKNLQPHFLLNTLAAVSELIERNPTEAVKFIDDLAAEFRTLALMSGERLVPLKREVELCRAHLKVISARTGRNYSLQVAGTDEEELVPPAIFLTLIENGLVHQKTDTGAVFQLVVPPAETGARYVFVSPGWTRESVGRPVGGTGLRYIRARLEESFPGRWTFSHGPVASGWETVIGWPANPSAGGAA